eukprot:4007565-Alexandrium_andersonii.AAC.1
MQDSRIHCSAGLPGPMPLASGERCQVVVCSVLCLSECGFLDLPSLFPACGPESASELPPHAGC